MRIIARLFLHLERPQLPSVRITQAHKIIRLKCCLLAGLLLGFSLQSLAATDYELGVQAYQSGEYETARQYWEKALSEGNASAAYNLGIALSKGLGGESDQRRAISLIKDAAQAGLAAAEHKLALAYYSGKGVPQDKAQAQFWWRRAAEQEHAQAQYNLAAMLWNADGVEKDQAQAVEWFSRASTAGNSQALAFLESIKAINQAPNTTKSELRIPDLGPENDAVTDRNPTINELLITARTAYTQQDYASALRAWEQAAQADSAYARYQLAHLYQAGLGIPTKPQRAFEYIQKAANQGFAAAQFEMGRYYIEGILLGKNDTLALYWIQSAADQGHAEAQRYIDQLR